MLAGGRTVYISMVLAKANEVFAPTAGFDPGALQAVIGRADTVADAAEALGYDDVIAAEHQQVLRDFLVTVPPSVSAAGMAAARSALERGLRVTITWKPAYAFSVEVWEAAEQDGAEWVGMVNVQIASRDPELEHPGAPSA